MKNDKIRKQIDLATTTVEKLKKIAAWEGRTVKNLIEHIITIYANQNTKK